MKKSNNNQIKYPSSRLKGLDEFMNFVREPEWRPSKIDVDLMKKLDMAKGKEGLAIQADSARVFL